MILTWRGKKGDRTNSFLIVYGLAISFIFLFLVSNIFLSFFVVSSCWCCCSRIFLIHPHVYIFVRRTGTHIYTTHTHTYQISYRCVYLSSGRPLTYQFPWPVISADQEVAEDKNAGSTRLYREGKRHWQWIRRSYTSWCGVSVLGQSSKFSRALLKTNILPNNHPNTHARSSHRMRPKKENWISNNFTICDLGLLAFADKEVDDAVLFFSLKRRRR